MEALQQRACLACPGRAGCLSELASTSQAAAAANNHASEEQEATVEQLVLDGAGAGAAGGEGCQHKPSRLLQLPVETLETILLGCDVRSLLALNQACSALHAYDARAGLRLVEKTAKAAVEAAAGAAATRWRRRCWLGRLFIEDAGVGFASFQWAPSASQQQPADPGPQYRFLRPSCPEAFLHIRLDGMGPKLLVSDLSTADQPLLRWRLVVRGNTAVEFGVVPLCLVDDDKALHKCQQEERKFDRLAGALADEQRPTGFCSSITVGSMLPFKTAIMKGSIVELLARRGRLEILVQNPPDGQELYWHNTRTIPKPYKGPKEVRFEQDFSPDHDIKLALTSWAHGAFDVLHPAPGSRLAGCHQDGWDRAAASSSEQQQQEPSQQPRAQQQSQPPPPPQSSQPPPQQPQQPAPQQQALAGSPSDGSTGASQAMMEQ